MKKNILKRSLSLLAGAVLAAALAVSAPAAGVHAAQAGLDQVSVSASSTVKVSPDMAQVVFAVESEGADPATAQAQNTEAVNAVLAVLTNLGVPAKSITTSDYYIYPKYDHTTGTYAGYQVQTTLTIKDISVTDLGSILTSCVQAGINEVRDVSYYCSTYDAAYEQALTKAMETAEGKASAIAKASGRSLGKVRSVTENDQNTSSRYESVSLKAAAADASLDTANSMNVMSGEITIEADVTAVYSLK